MPTKHEVVVDDVTITLIEQGRAVYGFHPEGEHDLLRIGKAIQETFPDRGHPSKSEWNCWSIGEDNQVGYAPASGPGTINGTRYVW